MPGSCATCGSPFTAGRSNQVYCSPECRTAARRKRPKPPRGSGANVVPVTPVTDGDGSSDGLVTAATRREFEVAGLLDTSDAQLALNLAKQIDAGGETGAGKSALAREFRAVKGAVLANAPRRGDLIDELEARRRAKAGA